MLKENMKITLDWIDAFNEHNIEKVLALYSNNADHYSPKLKLTQPETKGIISGKEAMRNWWSDAFNRLPDLHYELTTLSVSQEFVNMVYKRTAGKEEETEVNEMLHIKDGLIVSSAVRD